MTSKGSRSWPWSRQVRSPPFMRSCAGGSSISRNGFSPNMAYRSPNRSSAANCARWPPDQESGGLGAAAPS
jgi:hypothetical protein